MQTTEKGTDMGQTQEVLALVQEAPEGICYEDLADLIFSSGVTEDPDTAMLLAIDLHPDMTKAEKDAALEAVCA